MTSSLLPSTPRFSNLQMIDTPSPGKWRHPYLKEIVQRQNAARFNETNVRKIMWNGAALVTSGAIGKSLRQYILVLGSSLGMKTHPDIILLLVRLYFLINIATALYPLFRRQDEISDIPLTPSQRALLGLDPNNTPPATPGTAYITPPRYRLSSGPRKPSPLSPSSSPLSGRGSQYGGGLPYEGALYSPSPSPLFQRAVAGGNRDMMRRHSFGSSSSFGRSSFRDSGTLRIPSTPSPSAGRNANVHTNKWLYEKTGTFSPGGSILEK